MHIFCWFLFVVIVGGTFPLLAYAQSASTKTVPEREQNRLEMIKRYDSSPGNIYFGIDQSYIANPYYKKEVQKAIQKRRGDFSFLRMRDYYVQSSQYDPFANGIKNRIYEISYEVSQRLDPAESAPYLEEFDSIIKTHLANMNVILLAISLAEEDARYGDPAFYKWVMRGLLHELLKQGDGTSFNQSYGIITTDEEVLLLQHLGVKVVDMELIPYGSRYYNIHTVKDPRTGKKRELFIDITMPLAKAEHIESLKSRKLNLGRR